MNGHFAANNPAALGAHAAASDASAAAIEVLPTPPLPVKKRKRGAWSRNFIGTPGARSWREPIPYQASHTIIRVSTGAPRATLAMRLTSPV